MESFRKNHIDFSKKPDLCDELIEKIKENFDKHDCHLISQLSSKTNVPRRTLYNWEKQIKKNPDWKPYENHYLNCNRLFTDEEESGMADYIRSNYTHLGHLFQDRNLVNVANQAFQYKFLDSENPTEYYQYSTHFISNFKSRNGFVSKKKNLKKKSNSTKEKINSFKNHMRATIARAHSHNEVVANADETYFQIYPNNITTWADKGRDEINIQTNGNIKAHVTVMATICEDRTQVPLFFIAKGTTKICEKNQIGENISPHRSTHSETGWMRTEIFIEYLNFLRETIPNKLIHLLVDRHSTHTCDESVKEARRLNIVLHYVPSGATDIAQPLDVFVFGQLKNSVRKEVKDLIFACPEEKIEMKKAISILIDKWNEKNIFFNRAFDIFQQ